MGKNEITETRFLLFTLGEQPSFWPPPLTAHLTNFYITGQSTPMHLAVFKI